jgi:hypothetical protein
MAKTLVIYDYARRAGGQIYQEYHLRAERSEGMIGVRQRLAFALHYEEGWLVFPLQGFERAGKSVPG